MPRADQALLLRTPEGEAHAGASSYRKLRQTQGRLQHRGRAARIVIHTGSLTDAVEMRSDDNRAGGIAFRISYDVSRGAHACQDIHDQAHRHTLIIRRGGERTASLVPNPDDRHAGVACEAPSENTGSVVCALV